MSRPGVACAAIVSAILAALAVAGCGYEADALEESISESFSSEVRKFDLELESVSCPDEIEDEAGYRFECTMTTDSGRDIPVQARVNDDGEVAYGLTRKSLRELAFGSDKGGKP